MMAGSLKRADPDEDARSFAGSWANFSSAGDFSDILFDLAPPDDCLAKSL